MRRPIFNDWPETHDGYEIVRVIRFIRAGVWMITEELLERIPLEE